MPRSIPSTQIGPILGAIRSVPVPAKPFGDEASPPVQPFITISREPGAGAVAVGRQVVESLNANHPDEPWTCWDREIVEKIAADHHLSARLIDGLDEKRHSWMSDFLASLSFTDSASHFDDEK